MQPAAPWPQAIHPPTDMSCFEFRSGGFSEATHALEHDDGMLRLEISAGSVFEVVDWKLFTDALMTNTVLVSLSLADTRLPEGWTKDLASAICGNTRLEELDIFFIKMDENEVQDIARAADAHMALLSLSLEHCQIGDAGASHIARLLERGCSTRLTRLSVHDDTVGEKGASMLSKELSHPRCTINDLGIDKRSGYLGLISTNTSVKTLAIDGSFCAMEPDTGDIADLIIALEQNKSVTSLSMWLTIREGDYPPAVLDRGTGVTIYSQGVQYLDLFRYNRTLEALHFWAPPTLGWDFDWFIKSDAALLAFMRTLEECPRRHCLTLYFHQQEDPRWPTMSTCPGLPSVLPSDSMHQINEITERIRNANQAKLISFLLGTHWRTGKASSVRIMDNTNDVLEVVAMAYWGLL